VPISITEYQFQFRASRFVLLLSYAGAFGTALSACYLLVIAPGLPRPRAIAVAATAAALVLVSLLVLRRAYLQATLLCLGTAGVYVRSLLTERFVAWKDVVQVAATPSRLRVVFRDGAQTSEVWVTLSDATLAKRVGTYAARFVQPAARG